MPTHKLLLLAGDGIGPEVMAEVKKLIAWMNAHGMGTFEYRGGAGRRLLPTTPTASPSPTRPWPRRMACRRRDLRRGRRAEMGQGAV